MMPDANKIAYRTPPFGGLVVDARLFLHEGCNCGRQERYDLAANYNLGALAWVLGIVLAT